VDVGEPDQDCCLVPNEELVAEAFRMHGKRSLEFILE
jgi:hypothetical protein